MPCNLPNTHAEQIPSIQASPCYQIAVDRSLRTLRQLPARLSRPSVPRHAGIALDGPIAVAGLAEAKVVGPAVAVDQGPGVVPQDPVDGVVLVHHWAHQGQGALADPRPSSASKRSTTGRSNLRAARPAIPGGSAAGRNRASPRRPRRAPAPPPGRTSRRGERTGPPPAGRAARAGAAPTPSAVRA